MPATHVVGIWINRVGNEGMDDMGYMEKIREITSMDRRLGDGQPSPLTAPMFVVMLGLREEVKDQMVQELSGRWNAAKKYIRLLDVDASAAKVSLSETSEPEGILRRYKIELPHDWQERYKSAQLALYIGQLVTVAANELNGLGNMCSIHVVCGTESQDSFMAEKCGLLLQYYIGMMACSASIRTLFGYIPDDLPRYQDTVLAWKEKMAGWMERVTSEGMAPRFVNGRPDPNTLLPCNGLLGAQERTFSRIVLLDKIDSSGCPFTDEKMVHITALLMDPDSGIVWPKSEDGVNCGLYSAYLYPRYAEQHELDLALALRIWQDTVTDRLTQPNVQAPDTKDLNNRLISILRNAIQQRMDNIKGFTFGDITGFSNRTITRDELEQSDFGKVMRSQMDHVWLSTLIELRDGTIVKWKEAMRKMMAHVYAKSALENSNLMYPAVDKVEKSMLRSGGTELETAVVRREDSIPKVRNSLIQFATKSCFVRYDADKMAAVLEGGEKLKADVVVSAVLERGINEEIDELVEHRKAELDQILLQKRQCDDEIDTEVGVFRGEVQNIFGRTEFDMNARRAEVKDRLTEDLNIAYLRALSVDHEEQQGNVGSVLEKAYALFKEQGFEPIRCSVPETPDRLACRVIAMPTTNTFAPVSRGKDANLYVHIAPMNTMNVIAFNQNILGHRDKGE